MSYINENYRLDEAVRGLNRVAAELETRAARLREFIGAVDRERESVGDEPFLALRGNTFMHNVSTALADSARDGGARDRTAVQMDLFEAIVNHESKEK